VKSSMQALVSDLQNLSEEISLGPVLGAAIDKLDPDNQILKSQRSARSRRMAYVHAIISMYGLMEEHVDNLIMEVASTYQQIYTKYSDLPESVRGRHREYSLRVLLDGDRVPLRDPINEVVCLNVLAANYNNLPLQLNPAAFTYSTANYRHAHISELMLRLDIDIAGALTSQPFRSALVDSGLEFRDAEGLIIDLVSRRNEIAHSYQTVELLEVNVLSAYLDVIAAYMKQLFSIASDHLLRVLSQNRLISIGKAVKSWGERAAVGVDMIAGQILAPCRVLFIKEQRTFVRSAQSLQSNGINIEGKLESDGNVIQLGIGLDSQLPSAVEGAEVFVLPDRWIHLGI
jgi:hypothetical protein